MLRPDTGQTQDGLPWNEAARYDPEVPPCTALYPKFLYPKFLYPKFPWTRLSTALSPQAGYALPIPRGLLP